jgi:hypothetical protein
MTGGDLDTYISDHKALVKRIGWATDGDTSIESFKEGLPDALLRRILSRDDLPDDYDDWVKAAIKEQTKWMILRASGLTGKGRDVRQRWKDVLGKRMTANNPSKKKDPDAMEVDNI